MPELPEVETIRQGLTTCILGKKIRRVDVRKAKIVRNARQSFIKQLEGTHITAISRRGKLLIMPLSLESHFLLVHLKMTGQLIYVKKKKIVAGGHSYPTILDPLPNKYSHVIIEFADGSRLFFNDMRQFGYMHIVSAEELGSIVATYGVEPLSETYTWEVFQEVMKKRTTSLKAALLNQSIIAGIGNIYADEICFRAGVRPGRSVANLSLSEQKHVYEASKYILEKAMKYGGTTFSDYRDATGKKGNFTRLLKVYGRSGQLCLKCKTSVLQRKIIAGRGTVYCPMCQG